MLVSQAEIYSVPPYTPEADLRADKTASPVCWQD
jgi:hypothetical protein